jgi:hypothetical protein
MSNYQCSCGFQAENADQLDDHLGLSLIPDNDVAPDGQIHAEAATSEPTTEGAPGSGKACTCGFTGTAPEIDAHILLTFAPDEVSDSNQHAAIP